jgi:hypothetical protein
LLPSAVHQRCTRQYHSSVLTFKHARACWCGIRALACSRRASHWRQNGPVLFHDHVKKADAVATTSVSSGGVYSRILANARVQTSQVRLLLNCHCAGSGLQVDIQQAARCDSAGLLGGARLQIKHPWQPCVPSTHLSQSPSSTVTWKDHQT